jgi:RNA polymerase sigma-70 factor (ECF subfamily)
MTRVHASASARSGGRVRSKPAETQSRRPNRAAAASTARRAAAAPQPRAAESQAQQTQATRQATRDDFAALFRECLPHLRAYARSLSRNADVADDLVQDALLRGWAARSQFTMGTNFRAWMFTILRNRFLDECRNGRGREMRTGDLSSQDLVVGPTQEVVVEFDDMARAYWRLSPNHREIIMLAGAMGVSYEEAARIIGCPVGTVRSRLSRARTELHATLSARGSARRPRLAGGRATTAFLRALAAA